VLSPELIPETALPGQFKNQMERNPFFIYESRWHAPDPDGDVLMRDADSKKVIIGSSVLSELDERLRKLEFAKKSWESEVKKAKAKLNKDVMSRLDALEDFAESRYRNSRQRKIEHLVVNGWIFIWCLERI
jgi:hypothetical protein